MGNVKQRGVVLIMAMVMVVAIMAVAVTLMSTSTLDIKMTHAVMEREEAENLLFGEMQRLIQQEQPRSDNIFLRSRQQLADEGTTVQTPNGLQATVTNLNNGELELFCPRQYDYTEGFVCNMTEVEATVEYGDRGRHNVTIVMGIGQEIVSVSN
ncbi:pilus assembly protein PilX [Pseudoalteromonas piscicida]|uniref:pilus assembly protein PilX n=1 Tax=Pseudoalteromonas piscicida TaxID=43662 RepID=UPI001C9676AA|nr:pilus assembly protein PilX [Pseudoalteromonas piscicida]QZO11875.1 pilus assembly protein PilX [Pseudoalteromonas piscicida]